MKTFWAILKILAFSIAMFVFYSVLRNYVLKKIKIKHKWIVLVLGLITIVIQGILNPNPSYNVVSIILSALSVIFLLWYMDLKGFLRSSQLNDSQGSQGRGKYVSAYDEKKNKKNDIIKPKAKSNKAMKNSKK